MSLPEPGREPFLSSADGIAGRPRAAPEDFAVVERELLPPEAADGRHTVVRVIARNRETNLLVRDLARALGVQPRAIGFAGTKDKRAVTTQLMTMRASPEAIAAIELAGVTLEPLHRTLKTLRLGQLRGNRFAIRVADAVEAKARVPAILEELEGRFPNYFGVQRFGASRPVTHLVGEAMLQGDWQRAVETYIGAPSAESTDTSEAHAAAEAARAHYRDTNDLAGTLEALPGRLLFERQLVGHLLRNHDDWHVLVDERDRAVFHLPRRIALGVDVGDFLQLEGALESNRIHDAAAQKEEISGVEELLGNAMDLRVQRECFLDPAR